MAAFLFGGKRESAPLGNDKEEKGAGVHAGVDKRGGEEQGMRES